MEEKQTKNNNYKKRYYKKSQNKKAPPKDTLKVTPLGGLEEIGKNMTILEYKDQIMVIDCGLAFPDDDMLGVDLVIPDVSYLEENKSKIKGIVITHGHEDHIGGLPYILQKINVPVYCTRLTAGIIRNKLAEFKNVNSTNIRVVQAGDMVNLGIFHVEFIHVNHSIPDSCALAIKTPLGVIFHTGDFKLDTSPIDGQIMDVTRIGELGNEGVLLMMGESTNAERVGYTPSESTVGTSFETIFSKYTGKRIIVATFSSNVHRVQQIIDAAVRHKRKVVISGRSMKNIIGAAKELGYMSIPDDVLIDISEIKRYKNHQICIITTGSQGEPMSGLYRMAFGENYQVHLTKEDVVILSSHPIPGNEKLVGKIINHLIKNDIQVVNTGVADVHVSGHACQEELKLMLGLVRPKYFLPVHGENRQIFAHKELALQMGIPSNHIFLGENGKVLEISDKEARWNGSIPAGQVLVEGLGVGDVGAVVLRERKQLSEGGIIIVELALGRFEGELLSIPEFESKGFSYNKESDALWDGARAIAMKVVTAKNKSKKKHSISQIKSILKEELQKYFFSKTKRKPIIIPIIIEI